MSVTGQGFWFAVHDLGEACLRSAPFCFLCGNFTRTVHASLHQAAAWFGWGKGRCARWPRSCLSRPDTFRGRVGGGEPGKDCMDCKHVVVADRGGRIGSLPRSGSNEPFTGSPARPFGTTGNSSTPVAPTSMDWSPVIPTVRVAWRQRRVVCLRWHLRQRILRGSFREVPVATRRNRP